MFTLLEKVNAYRIQQKNTPLKIQQRGRVYELVESCRYYDYVLQQGKAAVVAFLQKELAYYQEYYNQAAE